MKVSQRGIHRCEVLPDHRLTAFSVSLLDRLLNSFDSFFLWNHTTYRKEASLHDRIDSIAELRFFCNAVCLNRIKLDVLVDDGSPERGLQLEG